MTPLLEFIDRHPIATGTFGSVAGFGAAIVEKLDQLAGPVVKLGQICAGLLSFFTLLLFLETQLRRLLRNRDQRRRHEADDTEDPL